jgi:hypothetical protein
VRRDEQEGLERERPRLQAGFAMELSDRLTRCWREVAMVAMNGERKASTAGTQNLGLQVATDERSDYQGA